MRDALVMAAGSFATIVVMDNRAEFSVQLSLNLLKQGSTVAVSALLLVGAAPRPGDVTYAIERRPGVRMSAISLDGRSALDPEPVSDSRAAISTATLAHKVTWRAVPDQAVIEKLKQEGLFWFPGGPTDNRSRRIRLHLKVDAKSKKQAIDMVRNVIEGAGGDASNLTIARSDPSRIEAMEEAVRQARR